MTPAFAGKVTTASIVMSIEDGGRSMKHTMGTFESARRQKLFYQSWLPDNQPPQAVLLIIHGLAEHCGRYGNVVDYFVPRGYAVYGLDHLGHGQSAGTRVYVDHFSDFTDNVKIYFDMIRQWQPDISIFIIGHSMGGLISVIYLLEHQHELAGVILSAPLIKAGDETPAMMIALAKIMATIWPKLPLAQVEAQGVSRDPAVVQAYIDDPLVYNGKVTARLGAELINAMQRAQTEAAAITLPIFILQGGGDLLVNPAGAQTLYDRASATDKQIKIYDGLYHEIFNEPEHAQVLGDVATWLEAHL
jgi:alpha-beta hydrolase superfamily lysophospholipase